jgi:threonine/homoserine/homoserine lactone efflux protein
MTSTQILQLIVVPMLLCMMLTTGLKTTFAEIRSALRDFFDATLLAVSGVVTYDLYLNLLAVAGVEFLLVLSGNYIRVRPRTYFQMLKFIIILWL